MSNINNALPREIRKSVRALQDDARLVDLIWSHLAAYHDMRGMELLQMPMNDAKADARTIQAAIKRLKSAIRLAGHTDRIPRATLRAIEALEAQYAEHLAYLDSIKKRNSQNAALRGLADNLARAFDAYGIPPHKLAAFIEAHIAAISPTGDTPPKSRAIHAAIKTARKV